MGQLKLFCVASDGRSLYGLSSGTNLDSGTKDPLVILVKSNPDPATLVQISWSVVSTVRISAIYDITQSQSRQVCAVDDKGVFTYLGQNVIKAPSTAGVKAGVQFSPLFPPNSSGSSTGTGGWKTIDIPATYSWQESTISEVLFSVLDPTGTANAVVHAFIGSGNTGVQFGTLDSTLQLKQGPLWATTDRIDKLDYYGNSLYFLTRGSGVDGTNLTMFSAPIGNSAISTAMPTTGGRSFNVMSVATFYNPSSCYSGFVTNTFFIACGEYTESIATMDVNIGTLSGYSKLASGMPKGRMDAFQPIGGYNGEAGFVFIQTTNATTAQSSLSGLIVQGGQIGEWQRVGYQANVTENVGYGSSTGPSTPSGSGTGSSSTGLIVGCVLGVLVLVAAAAYFGYYRRVVQKRKTEDKQTKEQPPQDATVGMNGGNPSHDDVPIKGGAFQNGKFPVNTTEMDAIELQKRPYDPRRDGPGPTNHSQHYLSTSSAYSGSIHSTTTPSSGTLTTGGLPEPPRVQQQFRLTSHPRPNFVTTVSTPLELEYDEEGKTALTSMPISRTSSSSTTPRMPPRPPGLSSGSILPQIPTST
ncbi:hypothetical protein BGX34_001055, partial [Mortierella sp. NVP85]